MRVVFVDFASVLVDRWGRRRGIRALAGPCRRLDYKLGSFPGAVWRAQGLGGSRVPRRLVLPSIVHKRKRVVGVLLGEATCRWTIGQHKLHNTSPVRACCLERKKIAPLSSTSRVPRQHFATNQNCPHIGQDHIIDSNQPSRYDVHDLYRTDPAQETCVTSLQIIRLPPGNMSYVNHADHEYICPKNI